ncbi:HEAT repeat domain-containing protein [Elusimicrobiota bacterium]
MKFNVLIKSAFTMTLVFFVCLVSAVDISAKKDTLKDKFDSDDVNVRRRACEDVSMQRNKEYVSTLIETIKNDESHFVRHACTEALGMMRAKNATGALLEVLTNDQNPAVRQQAAVSLGYIQDRGTIKGLLEALRKETVQSPRTAILQTLGVMRDQSSAKPLEEMLKTSSPTVKVTILTALGTIGAARSGAAISAELDSPDETVRSEAAKAIGRIKYEKAKPKLWELANKKISSIEKVALLYALSSMGDNKGLSAISKMSGNKNPRVRRLVAISLGNWGNAMPHYAAIKKLAQDKDMGVRVEAMRAETKFKVINKKLFTQTSPVPGKSKKRKSTP